MKTIDVTDANFNTEVLQTDTTVLIDFGAEWCGPCRLMNPVVDSIALEFEGKARVARIDVDSNPEITVKYGVKNLPTFLIFKNGELKERIVGAVPKSVLVRRA